MFSKWENSEPREIELIEERNRNMKLEPTIATKNHPEIEALKIKLDK